MNETDLIRELGGHDATLDALDKELAAWRARVPDAEAALDGAQAALEAARSALSQARKEEHATAHEVALYVKRRATATRALETGAGNPDSAQRQIDQCNEIIDSLELQELDQMEAIEARQADVVRAEAGVVQAEQLLAEAQGEAPGEIKAREAQRAVAQSARDGVWRQVPRELQNRYSLLRTKRKVAIAVIVDSSCMGCRVRVPMQDASDVGRGLLKNCSQCGRFLLSPP